MRAPSFKGLREDKAARRRARGRSRGRRRRGDRAGPQRRRRDLPPEALFDEVERLPDGALAVLADGRRLKISNWDKVLFPATASPRAT